jgi:hypothetical protein
MDAINDDIKLSIIFVLSYDTLFQRIVLRNIRLFFFIIVIQADRGCAAVAFFWGGGRGRLGKKGCYAPRATNFREERNPPQADSIVRFTVVLYFHTG